MPAQPARPLIGISTDFYAPKNAHPHLRLNAGYLDAVLAAGGLPVILPAVRKENFPELETLLDRVCGW